MEIFRADRVGHAALAATCSTTVYEVLKACADNPKAAMGVEVVEDPLVASIDEQANPAHALIHGWKVAVPSIRVALTKGIANSILKSARIRTVGP